MPNLSPLKTITEDDSHGVMYIGEAYPNTPKSSPGWRIRKIVYDNNSGTMEVMWPSRNFDQVWDNRVSLNYV